MSETYMIVVNEADNADALVAYAFGDLSTVAFVTRKALAEIKGKDGEYEFRISEVGAVGDTDAKRNVVTVSGDVDVVTFIAKRKLAAERKAHGDTDETDAPAATA